GAINSYFRAYHFSNVAYDRSLFRAALALADQVEVVQGKVVVDMPQKAIDLLEYDKDDWVYYRVTDPQGHTIAGEDDLALPAPLPVPGGHQYFDSTLGDKVVRVVAFSLPLAGTSAQGSVLVQVAETKSKRDQLADEIITSMMLPQILIVLFSGFMVYFGVRWGLSSLDRLQRAIESRSHLDLNAIPIEGSPREVHPLLHSMNDLLRRLQASMVQQQRFTADVSHQLRTPLAGIQTQAEMALRETDPVRIHHALEWIRSGTVRLSHLVNQLLALARVEVGADRNVDLHELDLVQLARDTTSEWVARALNRQIDLGFEATRGEVLIRGNLLLLQELISNLLDNAIRYTPVRGKITVTVDVDENGAILKVEDSGPGIPVAEREHIFERFYRSQESAGCGLGLAIVREIALIHHAQASVESGADGRGTQVRIQLPTSR
ncbi:MAG TPA: sensor histidine kinase N-terminal domain-containing protein, partial [Gallionella sp.]|nr:sensor histidine kinase N-terminal domain-containing protein [Gallionella sp.]